jgi:hypothetical protein
LPTTSKKGTSTYACSSIGDAETRLPDSGDEVSENETCIGTLKTKEGGGRTESDKGPAKRLKSLKRLEAYNRSKGTPWVPKDEQSLRNAEKATGLHGSIAKMQHSKMISQTETRDQRSSTLIAECLAQPQDINVAESSLQYVVPREGLELS